jgi:hypothetical protein
MSNALLIHVTGLLALAINVVALACSCERSLRLRSGVAGMVWALNNFLIGANVAAALSVVSASRTATAAVTLGARRSRAIGFGIFAALTLVVGVVTWAGWDSLLMVAASLLSTYAVFHLTGRSLRWVMLAVSGLWMFNAWSVGSWEQMAANVISAAASLWGACRVARTVEDQRPAPHFDVGSSRAGGFDGD